MVAVYDELEVRLMNAQKRTDADLRADVLQALMLDSLVPDTIDAAGIVGASTSSTRSS